MLGITRPMLASAARRTVRSMSTQKIRVGEAMGESLTRETRQILEHVSNKPLTSDQRCRYDFLRNLLSKPRLSAEEKKVIVQDHPDLRPYVESYAPTVTLFDSMPSKQSSVARTYFDQGFLAPQPVTQDGLNLISPLLSDFFNPTKKSPNALTNRHLLQLLTDENILRPVQDILGPNVVCTDLNIWHYKPPKAKLEEAPEQSTRTHSDIDAFVRDHYFKPELEADFNYVNVWVSFTGTRENNSPLYVFPKTHLWPITSPVHRLNFVRDQKENFDLNCKILSLIPPLSSDPSTRVWPLKTPPLEFAINHQQTLNMTSIDDLNSIKRTDLFTDPGDFALFSSHLLHGALANLSHLPRLAIVFRYASATKSPSHRMLFTRQANLLNGFSSQQLSRLEIPDGDSRFPVLQVSGNDRHPLLMPIHLPRLMEMI